MLQHKPQEVCSGEAVVFCGADSRPQMLGIKAKILEGAAGNVKQAVVTRHALESAALQTL